MSISILKTITVDFSDDAVYQYVAVKSEEVFSRVIEVILMNDGAEYIIPQGTTARLEARKSDNVPILIDGTIDYTLNRIYFSLTPKCTEIPGVIQCEIALYGEDNRLAISSFFYIDVHRSVLSGTGSANGCGNNVVSSSPEYEAFRTGLLALDDKIKQSNEVVGVVQKQMEEAREALDIATEAAETIVTARDEAFLAAESANNSASLANEATQAANEAVKTIDGVAETAAKAADEATLATQEVERIATAVVTAENARVVAEQERVSNETTRKNDEAKRVIAENNRVTAETARVEAEKLRVRESADAVDDAIDAATAANAASQNANNAIANLNTAINNANVAASYANQAAENVITTNGKMIAAEAERESAEETRQANESTRINQENARVDAELERESAFATAISNAETATQNANDAAQTAIEASQEASLQEAREAAISASESANAAADRATSFLDDAEANEEIRKSNEISRVSAEENRRTEFATWEIELGKISAFDKRIENLEVAVNPGLVSPMIDDAVAYVKDVPTGALPNAMISEIGGMTRKCENLLKTAISHQLLCTAEVASDGYLTLTSTTAGQSIFAIPFFAKLKANHTYYISLQGASSNIARVVIYNTPTGSNALDAFSRAGAYTPTQDITVYLGVYLMDYTAVGEKGGCYVMLNEGETALPYEPYFEGLRDAKVTAVESVGANLVSLPYIAQSGSGNGVTLVISDDGAVNLTGTATAALDIFLCEQVLPIGTYHLSADGLVSGVNICASNIDSNKVICYGGAFYLEAPKRVRIYLSVIKTFSNTTTIRPMLNKGEAAKPYTPYIKNTFQISEAVQALEGYGQGISKEYHNKIVLDPASGVKKFVRNVGAVDLGTLDWYLRGNQGNTFTADGTILGYKYGLNGLCVKYETSTRVDSDKTIFMYNSYLGNNIISITDTDYTDAATFKAAMNGVMLVYELATPTEIDISDYFGEDNLIGVEGGGTVTMVNEYEYDVPSVIEYTVKGVDAT